MRIDLTNFKLINVLDTCSIWNILSSNLIFLSALQNRVYFSVTQFVEYECLRKPRRGFSQADFELKSRMELGISEGKIKVCSLSISDLQDLDILERRKRLGRGELSTIVFAKKISQALITDDQSARKFANEVLGPNAVQTTPHLVGWMFYHRILTDSSLAEIIREHKYFARPLETYFQQVYRTALEWQLKANENIHLR
jgi:predicted nucleic acid-binding protein